MRRQFAFPVLELSLVCGIGLAKEAVQLAADQVVEQRMLSISEEMRCLVCQNESLAASRADLAQDLRKTPRRAEALLHEVTQ